MVFYKGPSTDNSTLVLANIAHKESNHLILNLDEWAFVCFIRMPELTGVTLLSSNNPCHSRAFAFVRNRLSGVLKVLMIEVDAWSAFDDKKLHIWSYLLNTADIRVTRELSFEELR